jgi:GR25 family glycosyltransferase involved in LPS biosynthesis
MKSYVITIRGNNKSIAAADRCIKSGLDFGEPIEKIWAYTPEADLETLMAGIDTSRFNEVYSRTDRCIAAFLSHKSLWERCVRMGEEIQVFEHDAVLRLEIPRFINYDYCINLGKPSYGKFNIPSILGVNPLTSKRYFPGAHAYRLNPKGAKLLLEAVPKNAAPTDVFLSTSNFPWLQEYYPWPVEAIDTFTTIQKKWGCVAKHNYGNNYEII